MVEDEGEFQPTLEELRVLTRNATRSVTDDPIGAYPRPRRDAAEEPWRLRHTPVDGETHR